MLKITWLGQGGFILEDNEVCIVIDPYLSDSLAKAGFQRTYPPSVELSQIKPDLICCTHDHGDHFDPETVLPLMKQFSNCLLLGPESVLNHALSLSMDEARFICVRPKERFQMQNFIITAVPAYHSDPQAIGFLIEWSEFTLYISGDTLNPVNLVPEILQIIPKKPDAVFICINGKYNNMDIENAVSVVKSLSPKAAIPMHYDLFPNNSVNPAPFVKAVGKLGINGVILTPGEAKLLTDLLP